MDSSCACLVLWDAAGSTIGQIFSEALWPPSPVWNRKATTASSAHPRHVVLSASTAVWKVWAKSSYVQEKQFLLSNPTANITQWKTTIPSQEGLQLSKGINS